MAGRKEGYLNPLRPCSMVSSSGKFYNPSHPVALYIHTHEIKKFLQFDLHYDQAPPSLSADYKFFVVRIQGFFIFISLEMPCL